MLMQTVSLVPDERYNRPRQMSIAFRHMTREGGERLRALLAEAMGGKHGWVTQLASAAHVRRATIYAWFEGTSEPKAETLHELSRATGLKRWQFLAAIDGDEVLDLSSPAGEERIRQIVDEQIARREGGR
jgi:transcriptional regulator with XRE-family HTH domain